MRVHPLLAASRLLSSWNARTDKVPIASVSFKPNPRHLVHHLEVGSCTTSSSFQMLFWRFLGDQMCPAIAVGATTDNNTWSVSKDLFVDIGVILMFSSYQGQCVYCLASPNDRQVDVGMWASSWCKHLLSISILTASVFSIPFFFFLGYSVSCIS